jgi:hypothetical protein
MTDCLASESLHPCAVPSSKLLQSLCRPSAQTATVALPLTVCGRASSATKADLRDELRKPSPAERLQLEENLRDGI